MKEKMETYIKHLHVANVGIFNNLDISFSPDINIIFGSNSSGKTSILRCLTYCMNDSGYSNSRFRENASFWADVLN